MVWCALVKACAGLSKGQFLEIVLQHQKESFSEEGLLIHPHEAAGLIGLAFILNDRERTSPLAMVSLVVIVEFDLPHCLEGPNVGMVIWMGCRSPLLVGATPSVS